MIKKIMFAVLIFFTFNNVWATCDTNRLNELKQYASKIQFTYDYTKSTNSNKNEGEYVVVNFKINAINLHENIQALIIYDYYLDDYAEFKYNSSKQSSLDGFFSGERVKVTFKAYTNDDCSGKTLSTKMISLPYYNTFYDSEECRQYPDFKYCNSELLTTSVSSSMFYKELENYKNSDDDKNSDNNKVPIVNEENYDDLIGMIIIGVSVLLLIVLIILKIRKARKKGSL